MALHDNVRETISVVQEVPSGVAKETGDSKAGPEMFPFQVLGMTK
jgi:hypothetical protein